MGSKRPQAPPAGGNEYRVATPQPPRKKIEEMQDFWRLRLAYLRANRRRRDAEKRIDDLRERLLELCGCDCLDEGELRQRVLQLCDAAGVEGEVE